MNQPELTRQREDVAKLISGVVSRHLDKIVTVNDVDITLVSEPPSPFNPRPLRVPGAEIKAHVFSMDGLDGRVQFRASLAIVQAIYDAMMSQVPTGARPGKFADEWFDVGHAIVEGPLSFNVSWHMVEDAPLASPMTAGMTSSAMWNPRMTSEDVRRQAAESVRHSAPVLEEIGARPPHLADAHVEVARDASRDVWVYNVGAVPVFTLTGRDLRRGVQPTINWDDLFDLLNLRAR